MSISIDLVSQRIQEIVEGKNDITFAELEQSVDASFNMVFLAIDRLVADHIISLKRGQRDYIISRLHQQKRLVLDNDCIN